MTRILILPMREIVNKVREHSTARRGGGFTATGLIEYVLLAWVRSNDEMWCTKRVSELASSSYVDYIYNYIADDMFEGDEFSAQAAFETFLTIEDDFSFIFDRLDIDGSNVILTEPIWMGSDLAIRLNE